MAYIIMPGGFGTLDELFESLTLIQTRKVTGVKLFVVGSEFYKPLLDFIDDKLVSNGMIDKSDLELITLSDDIEYIVKEIEISLDRQLEVLREAGLEQTTYYKSLNSLNKE